MCQKSKEKEKMNFKVQLGLGNNNWFDTTLRVCQKESEIYLEFGEPDSDPIISDRFYSFNQIEVSESRIILCGSTTRTIRFQNGRDLSNVWLFLQKFISFPTVRGPNEMFSISPKANTENNQESENRIPLSPLILKRNKEFERNCTIPEIETEAKIDFANSSSISFLSSIQTEVTRTRLKSILTEEAKTLNPSYLFSTLKFTKKSYAQLFETKLITGDFQILLADFKKLHSQWKNLLEDQWKNNSKLRKYVADLENAIESSNIQSETMRLVLHDSLVSLYFLRSKFTLTPLLFQLSTIFLQTYFVGAVNSNKIISQDGTEKTFEEACAMVFYSIQNFYNVFLEVASKDYIFPDFTYVLNIIKQRIMPHSPEISHFITANNIQNGEFLEKQYLESFIFQRSLEDAQTMIAALLLFDKPQNFMTMFVATVIAELDNRIGDNSHTQPETFKQIMQSEVKEISFQLLFFNVDRLIIFFQANPK
ncbi:hypothetical protein GPJ56_000051 [Histomonas meleagridis]|uniref:uncharacterized protein n=1 Tax=Histomonas meleagridis TaxID=135588 RepID=UPI00355A1F1C|nr:hypothetical protein GPJ56_000051 [Histomonas meleagridis]KAH0805549.1 hypothetical protein GO595_001604 [Histomonas meleagridis]